ncbi:MAG: nucleoside triphosphate pyrophosphohydrolase [Candidatus Cloacimonetes bacterium]|jgi:tetrapyrrole methylase family protein/MazG family protein|nr:nucleoside triphosphate pyrophosphohydrolase [Candidatus Cloacimonadota bacterium]MCB5286574.1 nucleoside triphosphate pyrophosphohydrolase [Candidatus Cloacimonadota bacterium]MCK9184273.1 nucleoside triphosphate pyrophosphohydrolase [Candidatus Cloacimonadota bacterium]MCK9583608.1 nucleoside triphosphate pyrophosphohydrolase [Candidatus Cloacimonadota bacterium]MDY0228896.1 nucleoside triphosphate pyrophosphohydrolase [Candidatus Cloacimonadaceae bacterium]
MNKFQELVDIIAALRDPETGCPWDAKQSSESLVSNFIEELYEVVEAIEEKDDKALCEELGDLLLHVVFQVQIAHEKKAFGMEDVLKAIIDKLVRRHPHVFGDLNVENADAVKLNWEHIKRVEKTDRESVLDGVPKSMPALIQAHRTQEKAASVGFDWPDLPPVLAKIDEEREELYEALNSNDADAIKEELGDLLFSIVNLSRKLGIDAEAALKEATRKFYRRFRYVEEQYSKTDIHEASLEELDSHWESAKNQ